jgi:hypothetical protein
MAGGMSGEDTRQGEKNCWRQQEQEYLRGYFKNCITFNKLFITKNYFNEPHNQIFQWLDHCDQQL